MYDHVKSKKQHTETAYTQRHFNNILTMYIFFIRRICLYSGIIN